MRQLAQPQKTTCHGPAPAPSPSSPATGKSRVPHRRQKHQHPTAPYSTTVPSAPVHPFNLQIPRGKHSLSLSVSGGKEVGGRRHLEPQRSKHGSILGRVAQSARRVCQVLSHMCCLKTKLGILHCLNRHTLQRRRKLSTCMLQPLGAHNMNHHTAEKDMHLRV